jgi:glycosyltransferase involved in cell wall biosynthesis
MVRLFMKKLAYVITQAEMGGAQKSILLLCKYLKSQYDITVYSAPDGGMIDELKLLGIPHIPVENMVREINFISDYKAYKFLVKEFKDKAYDIVHCHSSKAGIIAREAAESAGVKNIIYTAHGFVFNEPMNRYKKDLYVFLEKYEAKKSNSIICVDSNDVAIAKRLGMKCKGQITYIPNGIDFSKEDSTPSSNNHCFTFGLVANFYENKGHRYLIQAFNELIKKTEYRAELVLVGSGELEEEMKLLAKDNSFIKFLGFRKDAQDIMKSFDCFVMSSVKEGFPFVILEAIKNNVPIISTDVGAVRHILQDGDSGYIVKPFNSDELLMAMIHVLENKEEANRKAIKAYAYCSQNYSIENMINATKELYEIY